MQERITKAIITASYDDDGNFEEKVRRQYEKEVKSGYYLPTHLFLRNRNQHKVTKFNFPMPIGGLMNSSVPMISFAMLNTSRSELENIAVVGDETTRTNAEFLKDYFNDSKITYSSEGKEWKFSKTIENGMKSLSPESDELVLILMGDTPLKYDFDRILVDRDIGKSDLIADVNTRRKTGRCWPRKHHAKIFYRGRYLLFKEPQILLANIRKINELSENLGLEEPIWDMVYDSRKAHGNKGKSRKEKIFDILFPDPITGFSTLKDFGMIYNLQMLRHVLRKNGKPFPVNPKAIYRAVENRTGLRFLLKADNDDPATIEDVDGLADWANLSEMLSIAGDSIYPYYSEIKRFGEAIMPELRRRLDFYYGFEDYMNALFRKYSLPEPYVGKGDFVNPFTSDKIDVKTRKRSNKIIKGSIKLHKRYLRKMKIRRWLADQTFS
ncbi:hypothetical protein HYV89_00895 [Candidatus Woesearchaeota archaeon]|nr:hypothetical protein [Candidatus Woesearchaeota archaeon]